MTPNFWRRQRSMFPRFPTRPVDPTNRTGRNIHNEILCLRIVFDMCSIEPGYLRLYYSLSLFLNAGCFFDKFVSRRLVYEDIDDALFRVCGRHEK